MRTQLLTSFHEQIQQQQQRQPQQPPQQHQEVEEEDEDKENKREIEGNRGNCPLTAPLSHSVAIPPWNPLVVFLRLGVAFPHSEVLFGSTNSVLAQY